MRSRLQRAFTATVRFASFAVTGTAQRNTRCGAVRSADVKTFLIAPHGKRQAKTPGLPLIEPNRNMRSSLRQAQDITGPPAVSPLTGQGESEVIVPGPLADTAPVGYQGLSATLAEN